MSTLNVVSMSSNTRPRYEGVQDLPLVRCVPVQINQVFMNILVNAAHAIDKMGDAIR